MEGSQIYRHFLRVLTNFPSSIKSSSRSVKPRHQDVANPNGFPISDKYLAQAKIVLLVWLVTILCRSSLISLISRSTKSVTAIKRSNFQITRCIPERKGTGIQGTMNAQLLSLGKKCNQKSICKRASPPLTVIPLFAPKSTITEGFF